MKPKVRCPWCLGTKTQRRGDYPKTRYHCQNPECPHPWFYLEDAKIPKIYVLDIETLPIHARTWNIGKTRLSINNIIKDWCVLSYSVKELYKPAVRGEILTPQEAIAHDDSRLIKQLDTILNNGEIFITHNGISYDMGKIQARMLLHGYPPPKSYRNIDTKVAAQKAFNLTSNKLDYIGKYLGLGEKIHTDYQLWIDCDNGDKKALKEMLTYNKQDVLLLEDVYTILRPWVPNHPNLSLYVHDADIGSKVCKNCLSDNLSWGDEYFTNASVFSSYMCNNCGTIGRRAKRKRTNQNR